jgi:hypothetical protein
MEKRRFSLVMSDYILHGYHLHHLYDTYTRGSNVMLSDYRPEAKQFFSISNSAKGLIYIKN